MSSQTLPEENPLDDRPSHFKYGPDHTFSEIDKDEQTPEPRSTVPEFIWSDSTFDDVKQQWTGVIESIGGTDFTVRMIDSNLRNAPEEIAVMSIDDIPSDEQKFLEVGTSFVWTIGRRGNTSELFSKFAFRPLPKWSQQSVDEAENWGAEAFEKIDDPDSTATF